MRCTLVYNLAVEAQDTMPPTSATCHYGGRVIAALELIVGIKTSSDGFWPELDLVCSGYSFGVGLN